MTKQTNNMELAEQVLRRLLCPSYICEVSLRDGWPQIHFQHDETDGESSLWIDSNWRVEPEQNLPNELAPQQKRMIMLGGIAGAQVEGVHCAADGSLSINLDANRRLVIDGVPSDSQIIEPWVLTELRTDDSTKAAKLVGIAHDGVAVWPGGPVDTE